MFSSRIQSYGRHVLNIGNNAKIQKKNTYGSTMACNDIPEKVVYDGIVYGGRMTRPQFIEKIPELQTRHGDVIVTGYPRSGNNWMHYVVYLILNAANLDELDQWYNKRRFFLESTLYEGAKLEKTGVAFAMKSQEKHRILFSHLQFKYLREQIVTQGCKTIHVMRNPKDVLVSYFHFYRGSSVYGPYKGTWNQFFELYKKKQLTYGQWGDVVTSYLENKDLKNLLLVHYEDAKANLRKTVLEIADFLGKRGDLTEDRLNRIENMLSFNSMKADPQTNGSRLQSFINPGELLRKGKVGEWKSVFSKEQADYVDEQYSSVMRRVKEVSKL